MNPLIPSRPSLSFLLASVLATWSAAQPASFPRAAGAGPTLEQALLQENDPAAAKSFLDDQALQQREKTKDPALFDKLFARALELKDLKGLLSGPTTLHAMRLGLSSRSTCVFCHNPAELLKWTDRYFGLDKEGRKLMRSAVWEWSELPKERQDWLAAHGETKEDWSTHDFSQRQAKLEEWALPERDALLKLNPRTPEELAQMGARTDAVAEVLDNGDVAAAYERVQQAALAVEKVEEIRKALSEKEDAERRRLLADLDAAPDLETQLSLLSKAFDGADANSAAIRGAAPSQPGQTFDPPTRQMVAGLLRSGLMKETAGTWAGDELKAFYAKVPLQVKVEKAPSASYLAWYSDGVMTFNEAHIEEYVKSSGKTLKDLASPAVLEPLLRELAPVFVHEAAHHRQDVWAQEQNVPFRAGHGVESEAMEVGALFVNEKMKRDPSYREFLEKTKDISTNSREALSLAIRLKENGPEWFRRMVMSTHYPGYPTVESNEWLRMQPNGVISAEIEDELKRRESLPDWEQANLRKRPGFPKDQLTKEEFDALLKTVNTNVLIAQLKHQHAAVADEPRIYQAYRDRLAQSDALTLERLKILESDAEQRPQAEPPSPEKPE